jgi:hypothetical protein
MANKITEARIGKREISSPHTETAIYTCLIRLMSCWSPTSLLSAYCGVSVIHGGTRGAFWALMLS